jgi:uncharacterized phage protein gp47/JayE
MAINLPTYETIRASIQTLWQSERPNADSTRYSDLWLFSRVLGRMVYRMHLTAERVIAAIHPKTTYGDYLDAWLWFAGLDNGADGYGRIEARGSSTANGVTVTATGATVDLSGYQLTDEAGRVYEIAESYAFGGAGSAALDVDAITTGLATNLESGDSLTFSSPPANVTAAATVATDLTGGADRETDAEGRQRLADRFQSPPASGNVSDWMSTVESASPGELDVFVWPWRQNQPTGWGLTDYCALQRGASRSGRHIDSTDALYTTIAAAVASRMPIEHYYYSRQLTCVQTLYDIDILITMADTASSSQKCDWDAYGIAGAHKPTVSAVDAVNFTVTANKNITGWGDARDIVIGDKVTICGAQAEVTKVGVADGLATDAMIGVAAWFTTYDSEINPHPAPAAWTLTGNRLCSGGGLIMDVIDALFGMADALGPARGTYASTSITDWDDTLRLSLIQTVTINAGGGAIVDCTITLPAANATPTAGSTGTTQRIIIDDFAVYELK